LTKSIKKQDFNLCSTIIIGPGYPLRGGISESNQALQKSFIKENINCEIISYSLQYPSILFPGKTQIVDSQNNIVSNTINLINTLNPISWFRTVRYIMRNKPTFIIVRYWHPYFAICLGLICKMLKRKNLFIVGWIDNVDPHEKFPFQKQMNSFFFNSCDAFVVMSQTVKKKIDQYQFSKPKKVLVSPHPIYNIFGPSISKKIARKRIGIDSTDKNDKYILFFGLIRKYKGLDLLLEVMNSKKIRDMKIKLIIAGEFYENKNKYLEKIKSLKLEKSILIQDSYIPNEDVVNYFCAVDIVVQPYLSATQSGVSMIAYNFDKPILLTNVGGLSEYVEHNKNGYLVDVNHEQISTALEDFYTNGKEKEFSDVIRKKKKLYTWKNLVDSFSQLRDEGLIDDTRLPIDD